MILAPRKHPFSPVRYDHAALRREVERVALEIQAGGQVSIVRLIRAALPEEDRPSMTVVAGHRRALVKAGVLPPPPWQRPGVAPGPELAVAGPAPPRRRRRYLGPFAADCARLAKLRRCQHRELPTYLERKIKEVNS